MSKGDIVARPLRFGIKKDSPKHWNDNCPIKTHIFNAIAILAPAFERLAISSVLPYKHKIPPGALRDQVLGFIGQESAHGSEFMRYNLILKSQGYDTKRLEKSNLKNFKWVAKKLSAKMHLSLTLAAEHLTAIISDLVLRDRQWLQNAALPHCALWRWHAIEEIEHKAVVFDLYESIQGGYFVRILGMWFITGMLGGLLVRNFFHLIYKDKLLFKISFWIRCVVVCWGKAGFVRKLILPYLQYYLPRFHPWDQDNYGLIAQWKLFFASSSFEDMVQKLERDILTN
ncbi:MAG: metal-dependent hydrolase [Proteobacteria bacterium]|nr:metal-dependent hydrolase [Pseudomonadota bacterium]